jgi:hypothetical protein
MRQKAGERYITLATEMSALDFSGNLFSMQFCQLLVNFTYIDKVVTHSVIPAPSVSGRTNECATLKDTQNVILDCHSAPCSGR